MKLRVIREFYDKFHGFVLRAAGMKYIENNPKRAKQLIDDKFVKPADPVMEQPEGQPEMETKKPIRRGRPKKKTTTKKK